MAFVLKAPENYYGNIYSVLFFTVEQIEKLLQTPDALFAAGRLSEFLWRRDKALLELLYGSGIHIREWVALRCEHVQWERQLIRVLGKERKERIIPVNLEISSQTS